LPSSIRSGSTLTAASDGVAAFEKTPRFIIEIEIMKNIERMIGNDFLEIISGQPQHLISPQC
jgi:ribulose 1,5-bisphosphate carboxylase large subunit-like protein